MAVYNRFLPLTTVYVLAKTVFCRFLPRHAPAKPPLLQSQIATKTIKMEKYFDTKVGVTVFIILLLFTFALPYIVGMFKNNDPGTETKATA